MRGASAAAALAAGSAVTQVWQLPVHGVQAVCVCVCFHLCHKRCVLLGSSNLRLLTCLLLNTPPAGRKSCAITCATRLSQFLGDDRIKDKVGLLLVVLPLLLLMACLATASGGGGRSGTACCRRCCCCRCSAAPAPSCRLLPLASCRQTACRITLLNSVHLSLHNPAPVRAWCATT